MHSVHLYVLRGISVLRYTATNLIVFVYLKSTALDFPKVQPIFQGSPEKDLSLGTSESDSALSLRS